MFRSTTAPVSRFLNFVRVNAAPLPGLTNWNSTTVYGLPSINTLSPLRISDVSYMARRFYPSGIDLSTRPFRYDHTHFARERPSGAAGSRPGAARLVENARDAHRRAAALTDVARAVGSGSISSSTARP